MLNTLFNPYEANESSRISAENLTTGESITQLTTYYHIELLDKDIYTSSYFNIHFHIGDEIQIKRGSKKSIYKIQVVDGKLKFVNTGKGVKIQYNYGSVYDSFNLTVTHVYRENHPNTIYKAYYVEPDITST